MRRMATDPLLIFAIRWAPSGRPLSAVVVHYTSQQALAMLRLTEEDATAAEVVKIGVASVEQPEVIAEESL